MQGARAEPCLSLKPISTRPQSESCHIRDRGDLISVNHEDCSRGARSGQRAQPRKNYLISHSFSPQFGVRENPRARDEIYFSIVQRKVLIHNDFSSLAEVRERLLAFQHHYDQIAVPFQWTFTRLDLAALLARLSNHAQAHVA